MFSQSLFKQAALFVIRVETGGTFITGFYEQKASYSTPIKFLMLAGFLLILLIYVFSVYGLYGFGADSDERLALPLVLLVYLFAMWSFFGMKFRITCNGVVAVIPPFKYRIPFSEISSVEIMEEFPWYVGWGLRIWGRKLLFVGKHGRGVVITKEKGIFRTVVLVSENPDEFKKKIEATLGQIKMRAGIGP